MKLRTTAFLASLLYSTPVAAQQAEQPQIQSSTEELVVFDACYGDRYESDDDLNEGSRISDEEIQAVLNPPKS